MITRRKPESDTFLGSCFIGCIIIAGFIQKFGMIDDLLRTKCL